MTKVEQTPEALLTVDVAHPPLPPDRVEEILNESLGRVRYSAHLRVLKVIHGYGSSGAGGRTKTVVMNWTYGNRSRLRAVIRGEEYGLTQGDVQRMRIEIGPYLDDDLGRANPGITVCWVR